MEKLAQCMVQGCYGGKVTDVHNKTIQIKLNGGACAVAYMSKDSHMVGKGDLVSFVVTRLDQERGVAVGIITRITRQNI